MKKKKIVRVISRLNVGGPAIHTILLNSELNKRGNEDILVCGKASDSEGDMMYLAREKMVEPIVITDLGREISPLKDLKSFLRLFFIMREMRPDIVHTHAAKAGALGRLAALCAGVPVRVHTFHGHIFDGYFSPRKAKAFLLIERFLALFTDRVITVSDSVRDEIVDKLKVTSREKAMVIPLGFDLDKFLGCEKSHGNFRKNYGIDGDTLVVGIIGRLVAIKNHALFLEAARRVLDKKPPQMRVKFFVIGDGELREELHNCAARLGLEGAVIFTGWIGDLAEAYADMDMVVLTSLNEGTPVSLIEAMASARPVVAADVGGVRDLIRDGENGFLAESNDVEGFSEKILDLLNDGEKRLKFGARGREFAKAGFSKERLINDIENLYEECLKARAR